MMPIMPRNIDYCHINPLKHVLVEQVADLLRGIKALFNLSRYVARGIYPIDWATPLPLIDVDGERR